MTQNGSSEEEAFKSLVNKVEELLDKDMQLQERLKLLVEKSETPHRLEQLKAELAQESKKVQELAEFAGRRKKQQLDPEIEELQKQIFASRKRILEYGKANQGSNECIKW
eukprot:CAMPEP_0174256516 /NCGR_PEP_ID=MMETSP0439-20130205/5742_1 /TAXON_ID=0 /ORGANISM="Stereomyxa ramosa, Strain Chinc5" /LENGTH=109 /DNA_ID=CAMNT_0015339151 /DNA_START=14 /DNA_END=340 /DNA_ORIENTATION=-